MDVTSDAALPAKPATQVRDEYAAAASVGEWLVSEVGDYLVPDGERAERDAAATGAVTLAADALPDVLAAGLDADDAALFHLRIGTGPATRWLSLPRIPGPVELLEIAAAHADVGDAVRVLHVYADGTPVEMSTTWPFSMHNAVLMTSPAAHRIAGSLIAAADTDPSLLLPPTAPAPATRLVRTAAAAAVMVGVAVLAAARRR